LNENNLITEVEDIEGYINAHHINNAMINIDKKVADEVPFESIMVPEDQFTGMYSRIPLITYSNIEQLIFRCPTLLFYTLYLELKDMKKRKSN
jgi:hypothetical protein